MNNAIKLLNSMLAESDPHDTILMPLHQAELIATLDGRELGNALIQAIRRHGVAWALEKEGLLSRKVEISNSGSSDFVVASKM